MSFTRFLFFACVLINVSAMEQGAECQRGDGHRGICRELNQCISSGGTIGRAGNMRACNIHSFDQVIVCCRSNYRTIVGRQCNKWKQSLVSTRSGGQSCSRVQPLIIGGVTAGLNEFPSMVSIVRSENGGNFKHSCGGTLISENYVLTAAHCFPRDISHSLRTHAVRVGIHDHRDTAQYQEIRISNIVLHDKYRANKKYNDIAILHLANQVSLSSRVLPACLSLDTSDDRDEQTFTIAGWGYTRPSGGQAVDVLLKANVNGVRREDCEAHYGNHLDPTSEVSLGIMESMMCAGGRGKDTCQGDSGGPLLRMAQGGPCVHEIIGVTSFGTSCGTSTAPGVYTRVAAYLPWIVDIVWKDEV